MAAPVVVFYWFAGGHHLLFFAAPALVLDRFWRVCYIFIFCTQNSTKDFIGLRRIAIGKTIFLAFVWMYVTTILPLLIAGNPWQACFSWLACNRFFLIYAICILFDYRDREDDKADGIRSMITWLDEKGINKLFALSILLCSIFTVLLYTCGTGMGTILLLLIPGIIAAALYNYAKKHFSDYLYYFILDGLMMLSGLLMIIIHI